MSNEREKQMWNWGVPWTITVVRLRSPETVWAVKVTVEEGAGAVLLGTKLLGLGLRFLKGFFGALGL
jgi:hypothetical protein